MPAPVNGQPISTNCFIGADPSQARAAQGHWKRGLTYCEELQLDPYIQGKAELDDGILYLQVFVHRYWTRLIAPSKTTNELIQWKMQFMLSFKSWPQWGGADSWLNSFGKMDFCLQLTCWKAWGKQDPPPN
jgi:hypothetical protein